MKVNLHSRHQDDTKYRISFPKKIFSAFYSEANFCFVCFKTNTSRISISFTMWPVRNLNWRDDGIRSLLSWQVARIQSSHKIHVIAQESWRGMRKLLLNQLSFALIREPWMEVSFSKMPYLYDLCLVQNFLISWRVKFCVSCASGARENLCQNNIEVYFSETQPWHEVNMFLITCLVHVEFLFYLVSVRAGEQHNNLLYNRSG